MVRLVLLLCVLVSVSNSLPNQNNRGETGDLTPPNPISTSLRFENGIPPEVLLAASTNPRGDPLSLDPRAPGNRFNPKRLQYLWPKDAQPVKFPISPVPEARGADITQAHAGCCKTDSYQR